MSLQYIRLFLFVCDKLSTNTTESISSDFRDAKVGAIKSRVSLFSSERCQSDLA